MPVVLVRSLRPPNCADDMWRAAQELIVAVRAAGTHAWYVTSLDFTTTFQYIALGFLLPVK
jgi:S-formylglutathione hydrolase FrmB